MSILVTRFVALSCVAGLVLSGCGGTGEEGSAGTTGVVERASETPAAAAESEAPTPADDDFCSAVSEVSDHFVALDISLDTDWAVTVTNMRSGAKELAAIEPPQRLAGPWGQVSSFFTLVVDAFDGVDLGDDAAVESSLENLFGPETEAAATRASRGITQINKYVEESCPAGGTAGATTTGSKTTAGDACSLLDEDELTARVFVTSEPVAESRDTFGEDFLECVWTDGRSEVSVVLIPLVELQREFFDKYTPITTSPIDGLEGGLAYAGTLGLARVSGRGHSVSYTAGDRGGFVSVRIGDADSRAVEVGEAARLARLLVAGL